MGIAEALDSPERNQSAVGQDKRLARGREGVRQAIVREQHAGDFLTSGQDHATDAARFFCFNRRGFLFWFSPLFFPPPGGPDS